MNVVRCNECGQVLAAHVSIAPGLALPFSNSAAMAQAQAQCEQHADRCPGRPVEAKPDVVSAGARPTRTATVVGASLAGLLAARALSETFERVTVLDRDRWPSGPQPRGGVPQGAHSHGLLAKGTDVLNELFPGLIGELTAAGALTGDLQRDFRWTFQGGVLKQRESGLAGLVVSRPLLEHYVRQHVEMIGNVTIQQGANVTELVGDRASGTVSGVVVRDGSTERTITSDLVVDASGRTSRLPDHLERLGYGRPPETRIKIEVTYATRTFSRSADDLDGDLGMAIGTDPQTCRAGIILAQENDRWIVGLSHHGGERPPLEVEAYRDLAESIDAELGAVVRRGTPLDNGRTFRFPASVRRHYEKLTDFPDGLLTIGDSICSFNPVFGQGMSVSAIEALALRDALVDGTAGLAERYFQAITPIVDIPWQIAASSDRELPSNEEKNPLKARILNRYIARFQRAAHDDADLAGAFLRVVNLTAPPTSLMAPRYLLKVLGRRLPVKDAVRPATSLITPPAATTRVA